MAFFPTPAPQLKSGSGPGQALDNFDNLDWRPRGAVPDGYWSP